MGTPSGRRRRCPELLQAGEDAGDAEKDLVIARSMTRRHVDVLLADLAGDDVEGRPRA